ncbi:MAG: phosphatidate cytidylyltransferase [Verrucomicrobiales bacterium]|nr:phosphatidate cytidylyltransferase [Verrucomicrobiales bacterium]
MSNDDSSDSEKPTKRQVFGRRLFSTLILWGIVIAAFVLAIDWLFLLLACAVVFLGLIEYFSLFPILGFRRFRWQTYGVTAGYLGLLFARNWGFEPDWLVDLDGLAIAALVICVVLERLRAPLEGFRTLDEIAATIFGFIYIVILFSFVPKILMMDLRDVTGNPSSHFYVLFLLLVTKFTDMGAYAVGSLIGRDKMVPHVSPGKTWQGFGGAILFAFIASFGAYFLFGHKMPLITPLHAAILAVALAHVAVLGDLAESILKRSLEAKDSGHKMPGIGGVLDLIDSILFTAPILYVYLLILA